MKNVHRFVLLPCLVAHACCIAAASADQVFWTDRSLNLVGKVNSDGTGATNLVTGLNNPRPLATDGTYLYFGNNGGNPITRVNLDGSNSTTLINQAATGLFVDDSYIYYGIWGGGIWRANKDGTGAQNLIANTATGGQTTGFQGIFVNSSTIFSAITTMERSIAGPWLVERSRRL